MKYIMVPEDDLIDLLQLLYSLQDIFWKSDLISLKFKNFYHSQYLDHFRKYKKYERFDK